MGETEKGWTKWDMLGKSLDFLALFSLAAAISISVVNYPWAQFALAIGALVLSGAFGAGYVLVNEEKYSKPARSGLPR